MATVTDTAILLRGSRLDTVRTWADAHPRGDLSVTGAQFLDRVYPPATPFTGLRRAALLLLVVLTDQFLRGTAVLAVRNAADATQQPPGPAQQHAIALSRQLITDVLSPDTTL